jgi:LacI family transcriptional regulator
MPAASAHSAVRFRGHFRVVLLQAWWEDRVLSGVMRFAAEQEWALDCRMRWTHEVPGRERVDYDGIIAHAGTGTSSSPLVSFVRKAAVPTVDLQAEASPLRAPKVFVPHNLVGRAAAEHLKGIGLSEFGFVHVDRSAAEQERRAGFEAALGAEDRFHAIEAENLVAALKHGPRPIGIFAGNDFSAIHVMRACRDEGISVPDEVAIVGADDTELLCSAGPVTLSSVNCDFERQGYEAAALLHRLMRNQPATTAPLVIAPKGVTARRSTDMVAIPHVEAARALRFLRDNYTRPIQVSDVASVVRSLGAVQIAFRKYVGRTMMQELTRLRVERAKSMLADDEVHLDVIAQACGFSDRYHFARTFDRVEGRSPGSYRLALQAEQNCLMGAVADRAGQNFGVAQKATRELAQVE